MKRMPQRELKLARLLDPDANVRRLPMLRSDCVEGIRPCPYVSCKHHLYLDVTPTGSIKLNFPNVEPDELEYSCALDIADLGGVTLEDVGGALNITRERIRQLEKRALKRMLLAMKRARLTLEDLTAEVTTVQWFGGA